MPSVLVGMLTVAGIASSAKKLNSKKMSVRFVKRN